MATNNVTKNWAAAKASAEAALNKLVAQANAASFQITSLKEQIRKASTYPNTLRKLIAQDQAAGKDTKALESLLKEEQAKVDALQKKLTAAENTYNQLAAQINGYRAQIAEANTQLSAQARGTTPATNTTVSATVVPASPKPGNATAATTATTTNISSTANTTTRTAVTNTTNTTANVRATTTKTSNTVTKTSVTNTTNTTANARVTTTTTSNAVTKTSVTNTTNTTKTTPAPVAAEKKTPAAVQLAIETKYNAPLGVPSTPLEIEVRGLDGKKTGEKIIVEPPLIRDVGDVTANIAPVDLSGITPPPDLSTLPPAIGLTSGIQTAAGAATAQDQANFAAKEDWRVRLSLAPGTNYLYNAQDPKVLQPLQETDGVIFPYTPTITVNYAANYDPATIIHSNYRIYQYQGSSVDAVNITCDFTAQDVKEANYVLAVIHFFRTMTKMFYGQDSDPKNGTPPPLCYLYGMGGYQFDALPLAITGFSYNLPNDVDYIATTGASAAGTPQPSLRNGANNPGRLGGSIAPGGKPAPPNYGTTPTSAGESTTYVPTKINISISCLPMMSRNQVSNYFSLKDYASGDLLLGTRRPGGGMW